jgi:phosphoribosyl 1,2-cyclic phosphate phosphodiesterase
LRLTILGSAAAEGVPALFCDCPTCHEARRRGGRDLRRRTTYLWEDVLVDLGPDLLSQTLAFGLDLAPLRHALITHTHGDHFLPESSSSAAPVSPSSRRSRT